MGKELKMSICNHDCFNCIYSDCICNEPPDDLALHRQLDLEANRKYNPVAISQRKYRQSEKGKQSTYKYNHSVKGKATMSVYNKSEKGKERSRRYNQTEKRKAYKREYDKQRRLKLKEERELCM